MKQIVTPQQMQEIDQKTIQDFHISGEMLMENAGRAAFDFIKISVPEFQNKKIFIFCGKGSNGGDGLVIARHLKERGSIPSVFMVGSLNESKTEIRIAYNKLTAVGIQPSFFSEFSEALFDGQPDLVIDALLGTGATGALQDPLVKVVERINTWKDLGSRVIAVDIPSGLNGENGKTENGAVRADTTVTIGLPKTGLLFGDGKRYTGHLHIADIGFPEKLLTGGDLQLVEKADVKRLLKPRRHDAYKYDFGKVLIIAGSKGMSGAAYLAAKSALRIGAGLVKVAMPASTIHVIENSLPEAMSAALEETEDKTLSVKAKDRLGECIDWCDVVAIGPGLSQHKETMALVGKICRKLNKPAVIDADAIIALAGEFKWIQNIESEIIFTPHVGEFSALTGISKDRILHDRIISTRNFSKQFNKTLLLKGCPTLIAGKGGKVFVTRTGNPGMATAGSGDVLTGVVVGLMAQGLTAEEAGFSGAFIHGLAGDWAASEKTELGLIASDIMDYLPAAVASIVR
jgi:hydroxyethylthiazole kinase-like uncharacterized protein yjeF